MFKLSCVGLRCLKNGNRSACLVSYSSLSSTATVIKPQNNPEKVTKPVRPDTHAEKQGVKSSMVAAAFASLQSERPENDIKTPQTDSKIEKAETVHELLSITEGQGVSRRHAFKVVSVLANWTSSGKVTLSEFETDNRFVKLCRVLTKSSKNNRVVTTRSEDLSTIMNVTADDEAAKLVASITLPQMVKVMSTLAQKKRRSTLLLRSLSFNITGCAERLDLKQCADLFYSMAVLNFIDDNLLNKISNDTCLGMDDGIRTSAVIGSISTSMGLLKYKNSELLDALSDWILKNHNRCRPQDVFGFLMTLAVVNYLPLNADKLFEVLQPLLSYSEARKPLVWLDIVWSLVLLNRALDEHMSSLLSDDFVRQIEGSAALNVSTKLKLLNIDAAAAYLLKDYKLNRLSASSSIRDVNIIKSKEKTDLVESVIDSLRNLIRSDGNLRTNINSGLGFYIDAECVLDKKCNPLPLSQSDEKRKDAVRIAVMVLDYHDMCRGEVAPAGINAFACRILESKGYRVVIVPYTEFRTNDKLVHRVRYLETKLKETVASS